MTLTEALGILSPAGATAEDLKQAYRAAALKYHPDRAGGDLEMMKLVNAAFAYLKAALERGGWTAGHQAEADAAGNVADVILAMWAKLAGLEGLRGECCGTWLWVTGNTYPHRGTLKAAGLRWSKKKAAWYWHPEGYKKRSRRVFDLGEIRQMWGSEDLESNERAKVAGGGQRGFSW